MHNNIIAIIDWNFLLSQENVAAEDFRESICEHQPLTCIQALFEEMYSVSEDEQPSQDLLELVFIILFACWIFNIC